MKLEKEYLEKLVSEPSDAQFLENVFSQTPEFPFLDKLNKNLKKQVTLAVKFEKLLDGTLSAEQLEEDMNVTGEVKVVYKGYYIRGEISLTNLHEMLAFFGCNNNPKNDIVNDAYIFGAKNYKIFVAKNQYENNSKNLALLCVYDSREQVEAVTKEYFDFVSEINEMTDDEVLKLSYDVDELNYAKPYNDFNTNKDLFEIQDALFTTYTANPFDTILTLALVYRLRSYGWDKNYIFYASDGGKAFNVLSSTANIKISKLNIQKLVDSKHLDDNLDLTEKGRSVLLLMNYFSPMQTNNLGNYYAPLNYYTGIKEIPTDNFVSVNYENKLFFGIKDEFFVSEKCLSGMAKSYFRDDTQYNGFLNNMLNDFKRGREVGYAPNIQLSKNNTIDFEICQSLFNTFANDTLDTLGGLIMIKGYESAEPMFVNSLVFRLIKNNHYNISPFVSTVNKDYVVFKDNETNETVGIIKTKNFACQKGIISTQDRMALVKKLSNYYNDKVFSGLEISSNYPLILGQGFIEKAQLSVDDFNKLLSVPFAELKTILRGINRDTYYNDLNEMEVVHRIIQERKSDYDEFVNSVKQSMNDKLSTLEIIYNHFVEIGNADKQSYYQNVIADYKNKIDNFVI